MVGVVVFTHGELSKALVDTAAFILGPLERTISLGFAPSESEERIMERLQSAIRAVDDGEGVLVLVDMFGGTPSNLSLRLLEDRKLEVLTGVNLPMLLKIGSGREQRLSELASAVREVGISNIRLASDFLKGR